jgi:uncharacterized protein YecE (DUF72 family)
MDDNANLTRPQAARLAPKLQALAARGIYFGTSSWKYQGWVGSIYSGTRYLTRGKFSKARFEECCLAEYAQTFPTVCGDLTFYQFPSEQYWAKLFEATPENFIFGFKVPEDITVETWPTHARYGKRAGLANENFLNADVFAQFFTNRLARYGPQVGPLIFEFGTFNKKTFPTPADLLVVLDPFLAALPRGFLYAVETRNENYLTPHYFDVLAKHNVAHVFNAWTRMPELDQQAQIPEAFTADFTVVRALLKRGRAYDVAVQTFEPYERIQEPCESARAGIRMITEKAFAAKKSAFVFVNNRLEGNSPSTIEAVLERLESGRSGLLPLQDCGDL